MFIALLEAMWSSRVGQPGAATGSHLGAPHSPRSPRRALCCHLHLGLDGVGRTLSTLVTQSQLGGPWGLLVQP